MKKFFFSVTVLLVSFAGLSQNEHDLFRYSKTSYHGTARFEAMGGSFGALGADLSSSQVNPAGYGRYSSSQGGVSFYGGSTSNNATFAETMVSTNKGQGGLSNFTLVFTEDISNRSSGFLFRQLGLGYNQIENFRNSFRYEGQQYASLLDEFVGQAEGFFPEELNDFFPFSTDLAYNTHAITYNNTLQQFQSLLNSGDMYHNRTVDTKGGIGEFFVSYSTNYLNRLYIGGNVGIRSYRYFEEYNHTETLTDTTGTPLRSFDYQYNLRTKGVGLNVKLGVIYLVSESLRFGLAIHTPTFSELSDNFSANMTSTFADSTVYTSDTLMPTGDYKYKIRNPARIVGSIAYVFGTKGCVNIDIEYLNYQHAHLRSTDDPQYTPYDFKYENDVADQVFQDALNVRIGAEYAVIPGFYLRGGFGYYGNAFKKEMSSELKSDLFFSGGLGVKINKMSFDLSYRHRTNERNYYAFSSSTTNVTNTNGIVVLSGSVNF
jgi:hypothetical protein